jgi:hypothetical protein
MRFYTQALTAIVVLFGLVGCTTTTPPEAAAFHVQAVHEAIDEQRVCEAYAASKNYSFFNFYCRAASALPTDCEKPHTDDLQVCREWALQELNRRQVANQSGSQAAFISTLIF